MSASQQPPQEYADHVQLLAATEPALAQELAGFRSIEHVLGWMQKRDLCRATVDIVGMDEFEHDFLIQLEPGGRWLAFGVT
jgi:hypothetical protein